MPSFGLPEGEDPPRAVRALAERVAQDGGQVLALYREPVGGHWQAFCLLPREKVAPTPYQRDLSPTHAKRLQDVIKRLDRFVDPILAVSPEPGVYWTPNGNHRLRALEKLKAEMVPAILVPDVEVAYQILALNTEKAHNLKEKSLEVIRMYRVVAEEQPKSGEQDWAFQFEAPHFLTLGQIYDTDKRFAGGAFAPILKRVDAFLSGTFAKTRDAREGRAERVREADQALAKVVALVKKRGINHPFVKNYVLARSNPLSRQRKTLPSFDQTFEKLMANLADFDAAKVRYDEIRRAAAIVASSAIE